MFLETHIRLFRILAVISVVLIPMVVECHLVKRSAGKHHSCQTSTSWLDEDLSGVQLKLTNVKGSSEIVRKLVNRLKRGSDVKKPRQLWPGGVVKYYLNLTLTTSERSNFDAALKEYHDKTCIRFEPKGPADKNYVSVERDESVGCGAAYSCMMGGYQFARFSSLCMDKATFVHEFGHTLCLGHEHERPDRDEHITYRDCLFPTDIPAKRRTANHYGIYDYASQMHYSCSRAESDGCFGGYPNEEKDEILCGMDIHDGLSVMDSDTINDLYGCQGCQRHRWRPIQLFTQDDEKNLQNFGYVDEKGRKLYPCRAAFPGIIQVGMLTMEEKVCAFPHPKGLKRLVEKSQVEVLTIPGDLSGEGGKYYLKNVYDEDDLKGVLPIAIPAGYHVRGNFDIYGRKYYENFVAFARMRNPYKKGNKNKVSLIGTLFARSGWAEFAFPEGLQFTEEDYDALVCL